MISTQQEKDTKPITNNMQKVYREEQHYLGDDETTIVFTQNTTRITEPKASENKEDDDECPLGFPNPFEQVMG